MVHEHMLFLPNIHHKLLFVILKILSSTWTLWCETRAEPYQEANHKAFHHDHCDILGLLDSLLRHGDLVSALC